MSTTELNELKLLILMALGAGPAHGYAIGKELEQRTGGRVTPTTGTLYQALARLHEAGLIRAATPPSAEVDARRKYFELTPAGRQAVAAEVKRLDDLLTMARQRSLYPLGA